MKHIEYDFTSADIETILFTLSVLPSLGLEQSETQANINYQCCCSAGKKLILRNPDITPNEFRIIFSSLLAAQLINRGKIETDANTKKECADHLFTINKLVSVFGEQLS